MPIILVTLICKIESLKIIFFLKQLLNGENLNHAYVMLSHTWYSEIHCEI